MKIFIFNDLETGSYFDDKNVSTCKYTTLENEKDVLFVFPDQMLTHVKETERYKKRANLEASKFALFLYLSVSFTCVSI